MRTLDDVQRKTIHVKALYNLADEIDVRDALVNNSCVQNVEEVKVKSIRPTGRDSRIATVTLGKRDGKRLLKLGKIRVGLQMCKLQETLEVTRCFRCWSYEHWTNKCSGRDRKDDCLKCGTRGHKAKECKNDPYCPLCAEKGHSVGNIKCKKFTEAILRKRGTGKENA